jgi:hypothetical protein
VEIITKCVDNYTVCRSPKNVEIITKRGDHLTVWRSHFSYSLPTIQKSLWQFMAVIMKTDVTVDPFQDGTSEGAERGAGIGAEGVT